MLSTHHKNRIALAIGVVALCATPGFGSTIYFNNFETPGTALNGLTPSGTLSALSTTSLPTDSGGINSANQSTWLGRLGANIGKNPGQSETVTLALSGLVPGTAYGVAFDLLIGSSWDGSSTGYGPDEWSLTANSGANTTALVDATFSNCGLTNQLCGANSPQSYTDATPLAGTMGATVAPTTGSDFSSDVSGDYSQDYAIYYFSHGTGNPVLSFTAGASTANLVFQRTSGNSDSGDEYWALDNILVTGASQSVPSAPEPGSLILLGGGMVALFVRRRRAL